MKYSINWLQSKIENGFQPEYLFFWGHKQKAPGITDKSCLSQWWPAAFIVDDVSYATSEHWMMAKKALLFYDKEHFEAILKAQKPVIAKQLGRAVKNFDGKVWDTKAYELVVEGNHHKFSQHEDLKTFLLYTGDKVIVEASPADFIWGIGLTQDAPEAANPFKWKGTNLLGFALMEVRDLLRKR